MKAQKDLEKKIEEMTSTINKAISKEASSYWRKHIPVYGWTQMNYPGTICGSLWNKYLKKREDDEKKEEDHFDKQHLFSDENQDNENSGIRKNTKSMNEIVDSLKNLDPEDKFMKNNKNNDLKNFQEIFNNYEKNKKGLIIDNNVPHNFNIKKEQNLKKFTSELGLKTSYIWLTTDIHEKKKDYVNKNYFFSLKYCTIYPKHLILGPEPDRNFSKKIKKIGDISFEEETNESEKVKNLKRLPPDNITEESLKTNLSHETIILRLENHYWISRDILSKLGRMAVNLNVSN